MKKVASIVVILLICMILIACLVASILENVEESKQTLNFEFEQVVGKDNLYFDPNTGIVYIIFSKHSWSGYRGYGYMSPYYAPNGKPFLYDPNDHILIEID